MARPFTYDPIKAKEYLKANAKHQTITELSESLGINYVTVAKLLKELGLKALKDIGGNRNTEIDYNRICEYVRVNWEYETVREMSRFLNISIPVVYKAFGLAGLTPLKMGEIERINDGGAAHTKKKKELVETIKSQSKPSDIDYWPPFEELGARGHDALLRILAAAFWHDGRTPDQGCPDWEDHKKKMKAIRPRAEYNVVIKSDILREYLDSQGYHVKK